MSYPFGEAAKGSDGALPKEEFDRHVTNVRTRMVQKNLELLLVTSPENIFYLCGQQSPGYYMFQCLCLPLTGAPVLVLRGLEGANARANTYLDDIVVYEDGVNGAHFLSDEIKRRGWRSKRIGVEKQNAFLSVRQYETLADSLGELCDCSGLIERLRAVKSPIELQQIERAAEAAAAGMRAAISEIRAGATENDVVAAMIAAAYRHGSEYVGMEPFVCSGPRSGLRHATWRRRVLQDGDLITLENSACIGRYHSALFRTACVGQAPLKARKMRDACIEALEGGLASLRVGRTCADAHRAVQTVIDKHDFTDNFRKRSGYSMGISFAPDWGEGSVLSLFHDVDVPLVPGMVFHLPISLCEHGKFTVAASETAVVTDGECRSLSTIERALF